MDKEELNKLRRRAFISILIYIFTGYIIGCLFTKVLINFSLMQLIAFGFMIIFLFSILFPIRKQ